MPPPYKFNHFFVAHDSGKTPPSHQNQTLTLLANATEAHDCFVLPFGQVVLQPPLKAAL